MYHLFFSPIVFLLGRDLGLEGGFRRILGRAWGYKEAVGRCMAVDIGIDRSVEKGK
jgi:hypothetical protein